MAAGMPEPKAGAGAADLWKDVFDTLVEQAHRRDLRVLMDWVPNHTSDEHPWFIESRASRNSPKRDWYYWRDGERTTPPNNWPTIASRT